MWFFERSPKWLRLVSGTAGAHLTAALFPDRCLACKEILTEKAMFPMCFVCRQSLLPIGAPHCVQCGLPFENQSPDIIRKCGLCVANPPHFDMARSAFVYGEAIRDAVVRLKSSGNSRHAQQLVHLAYTIGAVPDWSDMDLVVAIPYFRARLQKRGFAPSTVIADALAALWKKKVEDDAVVRLRETETQRGKSAAGRRKNVRGAFESRRDIKGKSLVLVDDVMTTGATLDAASVALKAAGAKTIRCYTLGRAILS